MTRNVPTPAILIAAALFLIGLFGMGWAYEAWGSERIYPGVRVWDVSVGGLRPDEAAAALEDGLTVLGQPVFTLHGAGRSWGVRPVDLGLRLSAEATAAAAFRVGRDRGRGLLAHVWLLLAGRSLPPVVSYDEAIARLYLEALAEQVDQPPVDAALTMQGSRPVASPARPGRALDAGATLSAVELALTSLGSGGVDLVVREIPPQVFDAEEALVQAEAFLSEPFMLLLPDPREEDPGPWVLSVEELGAMISTAVGDGHLHLTLDQERLRAHLEGLAPELAVEPLNARFRFSERTGELTAIAASAEGRALDVEASLQTVLAAVDAGQHVAPLVVRAVSPQYSDSATAEELGIRTLVAEGDSYFIGSPSGRDHNIRLAASRFDGLVIPPGETFSFNEYLGEVSAEEGYDESLITAGEQLMMGIGGGICQVSTTAFRAALWGGYPITERWYHYQRVGYYELRGYGPGFDATVYSPLVDLKFTNDRQTPLLIETEVEEAAHRLVFRFYSTDDGREVVVEGPEVGDETEPGPPIYQLDEELARGTVVEWQSAQKGLTATVERSVYDAEGNLIDHTVFVSPYAPRRAAYHYGPGYEPPAE
jgi:vancomycin resistance protein YoaR